MKPTIENIKIARELLKNVIRHTPLELNNNISKVYEANVHLKREDLQLVRSYKLRGAYNKINSLSQEQRDKGVVCASAGNHAQGVAFACRTLGIKGTIFMPAPTPKQKVQQVEMHGGDAIEIVLIGDTYDDSYHSSVEFCNKNSGTFVHPFDDLKVIEGQGTVALEILEDAKESIDYLFIPIGGGGLASGLITVFKALSPDTKIIGVEPEGAASMQISIANGVNTTLDEIDNFIDGASVKRVGNINFETCKDGFHKVITVPKGKVCTTMLKLYNQDAIVVEPAGALSITALDSFKGLLKDKNVVCVVSGGNNDITRMEEIKELSLLHEGLKHYFIIRFPQRSGALKEFVDEILGPNDDITHFEYVKKHNREKGPSVVGVELKDNKDFEPLLGRIKDHGFYGEYLNDRPDLFQYLV
jgi:threonine dehydratase